MNILVSTIDQPAESEYFIRYSARMAKDLNCNLHLLYVQDAEAYPLSAGSSGMAAIQVEKNLKTDRENAVRILEEKVADQGLNISSETSVEIAVETGSRVHVIQRYADEKNAGLVALQANEDMNFWSLNATSMDVVRRLDIPVWVIPKEIEYEPYKNIVYATDYNEADVTTLKNLISLTKSLEPKIYAFHVTESIDFEEKIKTSGFRDLIKEKLDYEDVYIRSMLDREDGDLAENVNDFSMGVKANLIVLLKENRNFFERIFKTSSTGKIIKEANLPVLVYHEKK